jgi:hypothetical protein
MTKKRIRIFLIVLTAFVFAASFWNTTSAQRGRGSFSHSVAAHKKINCSSCHKNPTSNWTSVRGYPDVADYPGHASCIGCHRSDFFRGNRPAICAICHVNPSPRGKARFAFPVKSRSQEFTTIFPHDVHQDIIASNEKKFETVAVAHFVKASFNFIDDDEKKAQFNNCAICHQTTDKLPKYTTLKPLRTEMLEKPAAETFVAKAEFFKGMPDNHASCFNCHYQGVKPARTDCAGCHKLTAPYFESKTVSRFSLKFDHSSANHANKDCTVCHIRITQTSDLKMLTNADVPLLTCSSSSCHNKQILEEIGMREKSIADKKTIFQCNYCHTSEIGSFKIPATHLEQAK